LLLFSIQISLILLDFGSSVHVVISILAYLVE
jgi:hypothetical protein